MFWPFGPEAHGLLVPQPGIETVPSTVQGEVLTTSAREGLGCRILTRMHL